VRGLCEGDINCKQRIWTQSSKCIITDAMQFLDVRHKNSDPVLSLGGIRIEEADRYTLSLPYSDSMRKNISHGRLSSQKKLQGKLKA
jgi:hypothetical protein